MKCKKTLALTAGVFGVAVLVCASASAQVVEVAPPAPYREAVPAPRPGQVWQPGYWQWAHGRYVWAPGNWSVRPGAMRDNYRVPMMAEAPVMPPQPPRVERLSADALFPLDRGDMQDIRASGLADIATIAARLRAHPFSRIEVRGYTDRLGGDAHNLQLSIRRANAVKAVLVRNGVPEQKIRANGLGSQDSITQCSGLTNASLVRCLQPDRRVEIVTYIEDGGRWAR